MRLIDAEVLEKLLFDECKRQKCDRWDISAIISVVNKTPTIVPPPNNPLTLEELREMTGEPVWVERQGSDLPWDREWALVNRENCLCKTASGCVAFFELYGKTWLAYRRKPEEGTAL